MADISTVRRLQAALFAAVRAAGLADSIAHYQAGFNAASRRSVRTRADAAQRTHEKLLQMAMDAHNDAPDVSAAWIEKNVSLIQNRQALATGADLHAPYETLITQWRAFASDPKAVPDLRLYWGLRIPGFDS